MRMITGTLATTHVDREGETIDLDTLQSLVDQINSSYVPIGVEHDPRKPPIGRFTSAKLVQMEDGEFAVEGIGQIFEQGDELQVEDCREIPLHCFSSDEMSIVYDRGFRDQESLKTIDELSSSIRASTREEFKKSADPIYVLLIGGAFILGGIASGFLNKVGSDSFDFLKEKLKAIFSKKKSEKGEFLLSFEFTVSHGSSSINVETILSNPKEEDIDSFLNRGLGELDKMVHHYFSTELRLKKIVIAYEKKEMVVRFGICRNGVPYFPMSSE